MISFPTASPELLLRSLREYISSGKIKSWQSDDDGDFTHSSETWNQMAWLRASLEPHSLNFYIIRPKGVELSKAVYAIYHGRIIETILRHFDTSVDGEAAASAMPVGKDDVG